MRSVSFRNVGLLLAGAVVGFCLALTGAVLAGLDSRVPERLALPRSEARVLSEVLARVRRDYVDPVSERQLMEFALKGMLTELDTHSQLLNAREYAEIRDQTAGHYSGVGLEVQLRDGRVTITGALEGGAADRAGLLAGDVILAVDGRPVAGRDVAETVRRIRGRPGTVVALAVERPGAEGTLEFRLERRKLALHSVRVLPLSPGYGYVRLSRFNETTAGDLGRAIARLTEATGEPLAGLVLDLRGNPGGLLDGAVAVADLFLNGGVIVSARGRSREANFRHEATPGDVLAGASLVVLVDGGSASAAEIVAGALKDQGRATVLGRPTFGKGSVQTVTPLPAGRALKLTTSRYFTPAGTAIQGAGIQPDLELAEEIMAPRPGRVADGAELLARDPAVVTALDLLRPPLVVSDRRP